MHVFSQHSSELSCGRTWICGAPTRTRSLLGYKNAVNMVRAAKLASFRLLHAPYKETSQLFPTSTGHNSNLVSYRLQVGKNETCASHCQRMVRPFMAADHTQLTGHNIRHLTVKCFKLYWGFAKGCSWAFGTSSRLQSVLRTDPRWQVSSDGGR